MEYRVGLTVSPDVDAVRRALRNVDPGVTASLDGAGTLRVTTCAGQAELMAALIVAGACFDPTGVEVLPWACCGRCRR